jgi:hypothetical protein
VTQSYWHIRYDDAIKEYCPRCAAVPGDPCRTGFQHRVGFADETVAKWAINATVGTPMRRCHAERGGMAMLSKRMIPAPQRKQLTDWLRVYGPIFWEKL